MHEYLLFHDAEDIVGYVYSIIQEIVDCAYPEDLEEGTLLHELIDQLSEFDEDDLVKCYYHPMGAYHIVKLVEVEK